MNRRERKIMEKRLGLHKYKKNLTREERFRQMAENIEEGKRTQERMKEVRRLQEQGKKDEVDSARISSIATDLIVNKGMDWVSAQEEAKEIYKREVESASKEDK
jgi:hypothetical protein